MQIDVVELARGKWHYILPTLGVDQKFLNKKNGPCPMCGGKDRFRYTDFQGEGRYYCTQCGPGDGFDLCTKVAGKKFPEIRNFILNMPGTLRPVTNNLDKEECYKEQSKVWGNGRKPPVDGLVDRYFRSRGINFSNFKIKNIRQFEGNMIARVTDFDDMGINIHRTFLKVQSDGTVMNTEKKVMRGVIPKGSAIRLSPVETVMGIAEGIETALSAWSLFGVPTWSVISTMGMINWMPPKGVERVIVFGDNDANFSGQSAAYSIANRLVTQFKVSSQVLIPDIEGFDWNDVLRSKLNIGQVT